MAINAPPAQESADTTDDDGIEGPFTGYDRLGTPDHEYYVCTSCGDEAIRRRDLEAHDCTEASQ